MRRCHKRRAATPPNMNIYAKPIQRTFAKINEFISICYRCLRKAMKAFAEITRERSNGLLYRKTRAPPRRQIHIAFTTPHTNNDMARRLNGKLPPHCRPHWPHKTLNICCISAGHTQPHKPTEWIHFRVASCRRRAREMYSIAVR